MPPVMTSYEALTRRSFLGQMAGGIGAAAYATLGGPGTRCLAMPTGGGVPHFAPKAKRVIYLFQSGGPSQIDLFDFKPGFRDLHGTELPDSVRGGQRVTGMTAGQSSFPVVAPPFPAAHLVAPFQAQPWLRSRAVRPFRRSSLRRPGRTRATMSRFRRLFA